MPCLVDNSRAVDVDSRAMPSPRPSRPIITLTTDFGTRDYYVGAMKGVILSICPDATIVDITHEIEAQNIVHGAVVLRQTLDWFPSGTVHVAVVDPGVGTDRRIIAGRFNDQVVIAPDNGLLTLAARRRPAESVHQVSNHRYFARTVSVVFHGRDILSPVAAHVASGVALDDLGPPVHDLVTLDVAEPTSIHPRGLCGCVLYADHFGNLVTNLDTAAIDAIGSQPAPLDVYMNDVRIGPLRRTYADVPPGETLALIGSTGLLEIAVNADRASLRFGDWRTATVFLR